jgi:hypothetical protein
MNQHILYTISCSSKLPLLGYYQKQEQTPGGIQGGSIFRIHNYGFQKIKEPVLIYNRNSQNKIK